ncbi:MAG: 3-deoxy-D-manno-octulosonic acid transferase [bacterium]|nr:3-deoxy-D-manno-octulosonic acid transferase [bacterium]MCP5066245.1 3-deoxy-D-manno-octulosonic acid transferase [bacterium]
MGLLAHSLAALTALIGIPFGLLGLALRPAWRTGLAERLGLRSPQSAGAAPIWIHGASVGELQAALRLIDPLLARGEAVVATTTTTTGRALARRLRPELASGLAPIDHPWSTTAALNRTAPSVLVLIETELWPCWIASASRHGIPVLVVSGRISDRSFPRYRRMQRLLAPTLAGLAAVGARSEVDAERFVAIGLDSDRVEVTGDLKLAPPSAPAPLEGELVRALSATPCWVAGSTHPGEEIAALHATEEVRARGQKLVLVVAPRHPEKVDAAESALRAAGAKPRRRSALAGDVLEDGDVLLLDTLGELASLYGVAQAAFVGGSLVPVGGHNLLEPLQAGCPVLFGPHVGNARESARLLLDSGSGIQVSDSKALARALEDVLSENPRRRIEAGQLALELHRSAVDDVLALIDRVRGSAG